MVFNFKKIKVKIKCVIFLKKPKKPNNPVISTLISPNVLKLLSRSRVLCLFVCLISFVYCDFGLVGGFRGIVIVHFSVFVVDVALFVCLLELFCFVLVVFCGV